MFWFFAILISLLMAMIVCWPLLRAGGLLRSAGFSLLAVGIVICILLYREVGTPTAIGVDGRPTPATANHAPDDVQMEQLLQQLEQRLVENPADLDGWLILGRSYKTMGRYSEAVNAMNKAYAIAPENAVVMVELAEARMFVSGDPQVSEQDRLLLEQAVAADPDVQKGLWLLGIAATQAGNNDLAVEYWQRLLSQMEPGSTAASAIQEQLDTLQADTGIEVPPAAWQGFNVTVNAPDEGFQAPTGSVLFIIARRPGGSSGPPLGVRRIDAPSFPVQLVLTDSDSMMQQVPVSSIPNIEVLARLSMSGQPVASDEDIESPPVEVSIQSARSVTLQLGSD